MILQKQIKVLPATSHREEEFVVRKSFLFFPSLRRVDSLCHMMSLMHNCSFLFVLVTSDFIIIKNKVLAKF